MITLATLAQATAQKVFDQVAAHLLAQMERATHGGQDCSYRSNGGLACAAGCLMSDMEATQLEERGWLTASWNQLVNSEFAPSKHFDLIVELQKLHDQVDPPLWKSVLTGIAKDYALEFKPC